MSAVADVVLPRRRLAARVWSGALAAWGAFIGLSSFVIGPAISGGDEAPTPPGIEQRNGHEQHH